MKDASYYRIERIRQVRGKERTIYLMTEHKEIDGNNYYSIITGKNGSGKSNLLAKAINSLIFSNDSLAIKTLHNSRTAPSRVIAICNARFNRFPLKKTFLEKSLIDDKYYYIQSEPNLEVGEGYRTIISNCIKELSRKDIKAERLRDPEAIKEAYKMMGLSPALLVTLEFDKEGIEHFSQYLNISRDRSHLSESEKKELSEWDKINTTYNLSLDEVDYLYKKPLPQIVINFHNDVIKVSNNSLHILPLLLSALHHRIIKVKAIQVQRYNQSKWISIHALSSGEQSLLVNTVLLDTYVINDSLICIDEPENSLHPEWQIKYMEHINLICKNNNGCHFIIATHSPQIIAGMTSNHGCIVMLDQEKQKIKSIEDYKHHSSSKQLAEVFKTPGFSNEYMLRKLVLVLAKVTKGIELSNNESIYFNEISKSLPKYNLDEFDPVIGLIKQIKQLQGRKL